MNTYPEITRFLIGGVFLVLAIFGAARIAFPPPRRGAKGTPPRAVPAPPPRPGKLTAPEPWPDPPMSDVETAPCGQPGHPRVCDCPPPGIPRTRVVAECPPCKPPRLDPATRLRTLAAQADEKAGGLQPSILAAQYRERAATFRKAALIVEGKE